MRIKCRKFVFCKRAILLILILDNSIIIGIIHWRESMINKTDRYTYRITWTEDDKEYVGSCVEFPSLSWLAETPEAALKGIRIVVHEVLMDMINNDETPPQPLSLRSFSGKFVVRIPPEVHRELAIRAAEERISLNRLISSKLSQ